MDKQNLLIKINVNLKRRRICHFVALVIFSIQFILDLLLSFSDLLSNKITISWNTINFSNAYRWILLVVLILISIFDGLSRNKYIPAAEKIVEFSPLPKKSMNSVLISLVFFSPYLVALLAVLFGFYGTYGLASVPLLIGHVFFIITYINMKKYNKLFLSNQKQNLTQVNKLLAKTGKIFFVKYYNQLKSQNLIDIIDAIKENYSEQTKKSRIINAKKIFSMNLQIEALNEILENKDGVASQMIIDLTESILEKEKSEQLKEKQRIEKEREIKNEIIKPDCSKCRYNINEKRCEIWIKKPDKACEEFKLTKIK